MRTRDLRPFLPTVVTCFFLTRLMAGPVPTPEQLIRAAIAARHSQEAKGWKFTYREDQDQFERDKKGVTVPGTRSTFDVSLLEGEPYRKLILLNGQPLDAKMQKRVEQEMEVARAE